MLSFRVCAQLVPSSQGHPTPVNRLALQCGLVSSTRVSQAKPSSWFIMGWSQCLGSISCPSGPSSSSGVPGAASGQGLGPGKALTPQSELLSEAHQAVLIGVSLAEPGPNALSLFPALSLHFLAHWDLSCLCPPVQQ